MLNAITKLTKKELDESLDKLEYRINKQDTFNYYNNMNKIHYNAKSCYIVEKDTGLGFAHINARRDKNFRELQNLRYYADVIHKNKVYEL